MKIDLTACPDCPIGDFTCPYFKSHKCTMEAEGEGDPAEDCDDFMEYNHEVYAYEFDEEGEENDA